MATESEIEVLEDVSHSEAFGVLNSLVEGAEIAVETADDAKHKYARLHAELVHAMSRERTLLDDAKALKRRLDDDSAATSTAEDSSVEALREEVDAALAEASVAQEQQQMVQLEVTDLQRSRNELRQRVDELAVEQATALQPMIDTLRREVAGLQTDIATESERRDAAEREVAATRDWAALVAAEVEGLKEAHLVEKKALFKVVSLPEKGRRQVEAAASVLKSVRGQVESAANKLARIELLNREALEREAVVSEESTRMASALDKARNGAEQRERLCDDVRKDVEMAVIEAEKVIADQIDLDMRIKNLAADAKAEHEALARKNREKELLMRQFMVAEAALKEDRNLLPNLGFQVQQLMRDRAALELQHTSQRKEQEEVKRQLDINMSEFLQEEAVGKEQATMFMLTFKQVSCMEEELVQLKRGDVESSRVVMELGSQRDRLTLSIAQKLAKVKEVEASARIKDLEVAELKKIRKDIVRRTRDYDKLYDLVKNQRNKFVNLIQSANQSTTEMKDKSKILDNELDILHTEVFSKDKLLGQSRSQHTGAVSERDQLRIELGRLGATFRGKQDVVDEQIAEVDKLNAIINQMERAMLKLRKQYEVVIEARNYTGLMLIDRNDELCIMYEKVNIHEEVIKGGTLELAMRDDEVRMYRIEIMELERSIAATMKMVPQIPLLDEDVARLQKALLETRREAEALSIALENPGNHSRWRLLEGKIPDKEELGAKIQQLDERLNDKKEALLEKQLILDEITHLSDKLRPQAADGRGDTLELAQRVNEYQSRLRAVTRRVMATVSELSMYQANSLKLGAEKEDLEAEVEEGRSRMDQGMPPTDDTEHEWYRMERSRLAMDDAATMRAEERAILDSKLSDVQTTAEPRPNAYIPESLGIPKPYGGFAPFKPQEPGSNMRHIRKPEIKEIVI
ncbi:hypothetical protein FOA52_013560 [Chlamydomonas sp. UWO 241]|nr:hypothetical protein FOA52_013560 [Chlamydomonas sp. UWO 241]